MHLRASSWNGPINAVGGTNVQAGGAGAAVFAGLGSVRRQRQVGVYLAQEKPGAGVRVDQHGIFCDPAHTRALGNRPLQHRRTVDKGAILAATGHLPDPSRQRCEAFANQLVVVPRQRVAGDIGLVG